MPFRKKSAKASSPFSLAASSGLEPWKTQLPEIDDRGIFTLCSAPEPLLDIVFVHGLTGSSSGTWKEGVSGVVWPRDLLPHDLSRTRIMTFGYDADVVRAFSMSSGNTIRDHGAALAGQLGRMRLLGECDNRPLIFVAHSLGGLVCEQALLISRDATEPAINSIFSSVEGIIFMGTPHAGASLADWANMLRSLAGVVRRTNREILGVLQPGSEILAVLQQDFHTMLQKIAMPSPASGSYNQMQFAQNYSRRIRIFCFYEELPYPGIGFVVPHRSAILPGYPSEGIYANHSDMTKFSEPSQRGYQNVSQQLQIWARDIGSADRIHTNRASDASSTENRTGQGTSVPTVGLTRAAAGGSRVYSGTIYANQVIQGDFTLY